MKSKYLYSRKQIDKMLSKLDGYVVNWEIRPKLLATKEQGECEHGRAYLCHYDNGIPFMYCPHCRGEFHTELTKDGWSVLEPFTTPPEEQGECEHDWIEIIKDKLYTCTLCDEQINSNPTPPKERGETESDGKLSDYFVVGDLLDQLGQSYPCIVTQFQYECIEEVYKRLHSTKEQGEEAVERYRNDVVKRIHLVLNTNEGTTDWFDGLRVALDIIKNTHTPPKPEAKTIRVKGTGTGIENDGEAHSMYMGDGTSTFLNNTKPETKREDNCPHTWFPRKDDMGYYCPTCHSVKSGDKLKIVSSEPEAKRVEKIFVTHERRKWCEKPPDGRTLIELADKTNEIIDRLNTLSNRIEEERL